MVSAGRGRRRWPWGWGKVGYGSTAAGCWLVGGDSFLSPNRAPLHGFASHAALASPARRRVDVLDGNEGDRG